MFVFLILEYLFKFLLEIASIAPKVVYRHIPVLWLLSAYNATMSSLGEYFTLMITGNIYREGEER